MQMRSSLLDLAQRNQIHAFLTAAPEYLEKKKSDTEVVIQVLQGLVTLGLGGPARELVDSRKEFSSMAGADELRQSLDQLPEGLVSWDSLRKQFDRNVEALCFHHPEWRDQVEKLRQSLGGLDLYQSVDGFHHLSRRTGNGVRRWVPGLADSPRIASQKLTLTAADPPPALIGMGLHSILDQIYKATVPHDAGMTVPIYVFEEQQSAWAAWLHTADRRKLLRDPRLYYFVGENAVELYEQCLQSHEDLRAPGTLFVAPWSSDLGKRVRAAGCRIMRKQEESLGNLQTQILHRRDERTRDAWIKRIQPGAVILGITSRVSTVCQYSLRDMGKALEVLGFTFKLLMERDDHLPLTTLTQIRTVAEDDPALIIMINNFRRGSEEIFGHTPVLTWIQDPSALVMSSETGTSIGSLDFCCGYYKDQCVGEFSYPDESFFPTPFVPISPSLFHNTPLSPEENQRFDCDVAYVGHGVESPESYFQRILKKHDGEYRDFLQAIWNSVLEMIQTHSPFIFLDAPALIRDHAERFGLTLSPEECWNFGMYFAYRLYDLQFRRETLEWVAKWADRGNRCFKIYGKGWDQHPTLNRFAVGPIEHGEPLRMACRGAKIVLQTIPSGLNHQRTYEALACGSTVLGRYSLLNFGGMPMNQFRKKHGNGSDFSGSLYDYGFRGLDRVVFNNAEEFSEKAEAVMRGDETIEAARREMRQCVLEHFTYEAAFRHILERIRSSAPVAENSP